MKIVTGTEDDIPHSKDHPGQEDDDPHPPGEQQDGP